MDDQTISPTPSRIADEIHLSFYDALKVVTDGKKITKIEWENPEIYGFLDGEILKLHKDDGKNYQWIVSEGDLIGNDWIVL